MCRMPAQLVIFQSTLPVRGATQRDELVELAREFQSTLPVRGATFVLDLLPEMREISIHAPCEGSDALWSRPSIAAAHFNPRSL